MIYQLLYDEKPDLLISIFRNASMLLAAILDYLSMGEVLQDVASRNSDKPMTVLLTLLHGEMTRGLRNVSVPRDCVLKLHMHSNQNLIVSTPLCYLLQITISQAK